MKNNKKHYIRRDQRFSLHKEKNNTENFKNQEGSKKTFYITISGQEKIDGDFKKNV